MGPTSSASSTQFAAVPDFDQQVPVLFSKYNFLLPKHRLHGTKKSWAFTPGLETNITFLLLNRPVTPSHTARRVPHIDTPVMSQSCYIIMIIIICYHGETAFRHAVSSGIISAGG